MNKTPFPIKCWLKVHGIMIGHCFVSKGAKGVAYQGQKRKTEVKGGWKDQCVNSLVADWRSRGLRLVACSVRIFLHSFLHKKFGHHLGFFKTRKVKEGKKYLMGRGVYWAREKWGWGWGEREGVGTSWNILFLFTYPISYPHIPGKREMLMRKGDKKDDSFTLSTSMKRKKGEEKGK